ncbi:MAG: carboxylesterase family protein [Bacteroidales bacterium]|nr:carboxylesterase family protein [Bacteroidales bacterium]MBR5670539.1 carboxylesterase family protein [Bacteroidales bacterium]
MKKLLMILLGVLAIAACTKTSKNPILTIEGGQIQGVQLDDAPGVTVYRGIPYAAPPIGQNRWRAPQPVEPWDGVRICDTFGHPPYQAVHYPGGYTTEWGYGEEAPYSEDCLYLNVWTKAPGQVNKKLPVAVWVFGGGLREGWGSEPEFDGKYWGAKDVVLVTFNYRVGPFGFFAHPELSAENPEHPTGNWGTLDQIEVLKWVQRNIAQFGGDPDNVMLFGQSAGGRSTKFLSASPLTKGLFDKAVIMSASGLVDPRAAQQAAPAIQGMPAMPMTSQAHYTLAEAEASTKEVADWAGFKDLASLRRASTETIYAMGTLYTSATGKRSVLSASPIAPYIDGYVMDKTFDDACIDGSLADIPYMIGYTLNDAGNMAGQIRTFCLNREEMGGKAWAYQFARPLPTDGRANVLSGAFHSSDLWFVFKSLEHCWRPWTQGDWDLSEKMLTAWSNFAKYSDPNGPDGGVWAPYTAATPKFMVWKLDDADAEASEFGEPQTPPRPAMGTRR